MGGEYQNKYHKAPSGAFFYDQNPGALMSDDLEIEAVENDINDQPENTSETLRETLQNAVTEVKEREKAEPIEKPSKSRDRSGKFAKNIEESANDLPEVSVIEEQKPISAPQGWKAEVKAKWNELSPDIQAEILRREEDSHKALTRQDEERNFGKQLKDVITPYMPLIAAEGGNPAAAVQSLLNTAYQLRTGTPQQRGQLIMQLAQQYGADISQNSSPAYVDPQIQALEQRYMSLEQQIQREQQSKQQQQQSAINTEIETFASNPAHVHFESVKAHMAALLQNGLATDMKDAYDQAVYARPDIRSTLIAEQQAQAEAKRQEAIKQKSQAARNASGSLKGAPGGAVPNKAHQSLDLRETIKAAFAEHAS